jgi:YD repeat-containing protein
VTIRVGHLEFNYVTYDDVRDVLYLSIDEPYEAADAEATTGGHQVRYDEAGRVIGITFVNAKWLLERDGEIELPIRVPADDLALALA